MKPEELERLRENSGMRLDADGRFWHEDRPVEHPRVIELFRHGLGRAPDGRATLMVGRTWCYIRVEDTLFRVDGAHCTPKDGRLVECELVIDNGTSEKLSRAPNALALDADGVLYARIKGGSEWARLSPHAQSSIGPYLVETDGGWALGWLEGDCPVGVKS